MAQTPDGSDIAAIIGASAAAEQAKSPPAADDVATLAERVDLLTADFGRWEEYKAASAEYVKEFTTEIRWLRRIRLAVAIACAVLVIFFCGGLIAVLALAQNIFGKDPGHALTALIVAGIGGTVVIAITAIKGAFGTTVDRNEGLPMPEHLKEVVEVVKEMLGRHG